MAGYYATVRGGSGKLPVSIVGQVLDNLFLPSIDPVLDAFPQKLHYSFPLFHDH
jgi:hypothetical protein